MVVMTLSLTPFTQPRLSVVSQLPDTISHPQIMQAPYLRAVTLRIVLSKRKNIGLQKSSLIVIFYMEMLFLKGPRPKGGPHGARRVRLF